MFRRLKILIVAAFLAAAFAAGWFLRLETVERQNAGIASPEGIIRESGYDLTNPLLVCSRDESAALDERMQRIIQNAVNDEVKKGNVNTASVYYRSFSDSSWATLNGDEKYYPASLSKVPLMIAYYGFNEEVDYPLLTKSIYLPPSYEENQQQEIQPQHPLHTGKSYTANELLDAMITDSDNNAALLLFQNINQDFVRRVFEDLHVPYLAPGQPPNNFMDISDYAFFFRVLYNGTYLSHYDSERALHLLSESTFRDGLVSGVPPGTIVAHKFGLVSVAPDNKAVTARELHDCGIVYPAGKNPYLLCVMTKSLGPLQGAERAIADISRAVYRRANQ